MEGELETGFKWWVRYVIVPLLGGGTIVTLIIALAKPGNNTQSPPDARQQTAKKQYIPPKEDPKLISTDHPDPKFPVDNRVTSLNYQVKSGESKINGGAEILAPNGSRPARAGELCSFSWVIGGLQVKETIYFTVRANGVVKSRTPVTTKDNNSTHVALDESYSLESDAGSLFIFPLKVR